MVSVQFPPPQFNIKTEEGKRFIFDGIRKSWLVLTEEEWVRQNLVAYFTTTLRYPPAFIALEKELLLNGLRKRFDILIYDTNHQPWMLVECKAPSVKLSGEVLQQLLRYNITIPSPYLVISNGEQTIAWKKSGDGLVEIEALPSYRL